MQLRPWLPLDWDMVRILRIVCAIRFCRPMVLIVTMQLSNTRGTDSSRRALSSLDRLSIRGCPRTLRAV